MRYAWLLLALVVTAASAKRIYTYRDENGVLHFTDRKPDTEQEVEERIVRVEGQRMVTVRQGGPEDAREYYFFNHWHGPVSVALSFTDASNVASDPPLPAEFLLPEHGESQLLTVRQADPRRGSQYRLQYKTVPGDPSATPDAVQRYEMPFRRGKRYVIGQAFGGVATHTDAQSFHAVDISLPLGTPVLAARDGLVMHVEEDFYGAGLDEAKYATRANSVRVLHDDGTMAVYAHLQLESVGCKGRTRRGRRRVAGSFREHWLFDRAAPAFCGSAQQPR